MATAVLPTSLRRGTRRAPLDSAVIGASGGAVSPGTRMPGVPGVPGVPRPGGRPGAGVLPPGPAPGGTPGPGTSPQPYWQNPPPINVQTPVDPSQAAATQGWQEYSNELQAGTAAETERELQRYRDELSKGLQSEGEAAIARGADPSLFRSRALEGGRRGLLELQGRLADVSLGRRAEALGGMTTAAGAAASERRMLHLGTIASQQAAQQLLLQQAEAQARLQEQPYQRLMELMGVMGGTADVFSGLTGGGGGGGGLVGGPIRPGVGGGGGRVGVTPR